MKDKKNIDRLFQEKLRDFEIAPPEQAWKNIREKLEKKKKNILPLWLKISGIAAVFLLGFIIFKPFNQTLPDNNIVIENNLPDEIEEKDNIIKNQTHPQVVFEDNSQNEDNLKKNYEKEIVLPSVRSSEGDIVFSSSKKNVSNTTKQKAENYSNSNEVIKQEPDFTENNILSDVLAKTSENSLLNDSISNNDDIVLEVITRKRIVTPTGIITEENTKTENLTESSLVQENVLEQLLKQKQEAEKENDNLVLNVAEKEKWTVKPNLAPVFYNTLSNGSPIDSQFEKNTKSYGNNMSYGLGIEYAITDRFSVRSGINTVNLSYETNNVIYFPDFTASMRNIDMADNNSNAYISVQNQQTFLANQSESAEVAKQGFQGALLQETGYIEVPMELSYKIVDSKFGIDVIGGFSTLFLNKNNISLISEEGYESVLGEANNLNNVNFSTNIGLGFKYNFWKSFNARFEPMFKYQINTFSGNSGNFRPYFIGLYSGVSFSF